MSAENRRAAAEVTPPIAARRDVVHESHGDQRKDAYAWLRDTDNPDVLAHLTAERSYYDAATRHLHSQVRTLSEEMSSRVPATDSSISYRRIRHSYYTQTPAGSEYEQLCRGVYPDTSEDDAPLTDARVLLDPATLVGDSPYIELGLTLVSPDETVLAYSVDTTGDEVYTLRFRNLETGQDLPDLVHRTYYTGAWSADSSTFLYTVHDEKHLPNEVWRHRLGSAAGDDVLVQREDDKRFELEVRGCRSGDVIEIAVSSRDTSEVWLVDAHAPEAPARCVEPRQRGIEYRVEHARTHSGDRLFIVTNHDAQEYRLMSAALSEPGRARWIEVVAENPAERLHAATAFRGHVVTTLRRDGHLMARSYAIGTDGGLTTPGLKLVAAVGVGTLELGPNECYDAAEVTIVEQSFTEPPAWYAVALSTGARRLRRRLAPNYDPSQYVSEVIHAPLVGGALGGAEGDQGGPGGVPVTLVRRTDTPLDGTAPCLQYAYGAYEACSTVAWSTRMPTSAGAARVADAGGSPAVSPASRTRSPTTLQWRTTWPRVSSMAAGS